MEYYKKSYNEMMHILKRNNGIISSNRLNEIFHAFQIASGQTYFKSNINAIIDYFEIANSIVFEYPTRKLKITSTKELESFFQKIDPSFNFSLLNRS